MDRTDDPGDLARLARRVVDGKRVDWEREVLDAKITPEQARHLRLVERISDVHRGLLTEELPFDSWGPLDLERPIASGGFGDIYQARDRNLDREVALKLFVDDAERGRAPDAFIEEARRLATVRHPNVVTIHGVDRHRGRAGMWMDWIDGDTLEELIDDRGPFSAEEAVRVGVELCRALAAIHAAGLVHRDVKLSNVMRERGGRIVLMDFGSSTRIADGERPSLGTPIYLAPEVFEGSDSGQRVDIYALGVLLYRLTSGEYPLQFGTSVEMRQAHREGRLVPLRDRNPTLPPSFVRCVELAMHPDPDKRFRSVGRMERALTDSIAGKAFDPRPRRRTRMFAWAAMLVVGLIAAAIFAHRFFSTSFSPEVRFHRFTPQGTNEQLFSGVRVAKGDQIALELRTDRRAWIYVVNADASGQQFLLFPVPGLEMDNPVPAGTTWFPGYVEGIEQGWEVTSSNGRELILVVASTRPLDVVEDRLAELQSVVPNGPLRLDDPGTADTLRGLGKVSPSPRGRLWEETPVVGEIVDGVAIRLGEAEGIRVWELVLPNPE